MWPITTGTDQRSHYQIAILKHRMKNAMTGPKLNLLIPAAKICMDYLTVSIFDE